jgi:hypothetical protein
MPRILDTELRTYEQNRERLLEESEGKYVLIHGDQILGRFESDTDAINAGYEQLGNVPFLVKQVLSVEIPARLSCSLLGV